jgi:hypothetical protein
VDKRMNTGNLEVLKKLQPQQKLTAALKEERMKELNVNSAQLKLILEKYGNKYNY